MSARNNTLMGPWEVWRRIALLLSLLFSIFIIIFVNVPSGLSAILLMVCIAKIWKPIGVTDPTLGAYIPDTKPFKVAQFWMAYDRRKSQVLSPMVSVGFGPPGPDQDHDIDTPGWFPPTRLSAIWCFVSAAPLAAIDYLIHPAIYPFWDSDMKLPMVAQLIVSYIGWFALLQSIVAVRRIQGDRKRIIAIEPAPATMLHKVHGSSRISNVIGKSFGIGLVLAFVVFVLWWLMDWSLTVGLTATIVALSITFLISASKILQKEYQEHWRERNRRREFWEGTLDFMKEFNPTLVSERQLPTYEQWLEMDPDDDEPYAPNINVATFMFAPNANFWDYFGREQRINGALEATFSSISPIEDVDEFTGQPILGTVSNQGFRIWWTQERISIDTILSPDTDPVMREFGVRSIIVPELAKIKNIGECVLHSYSMITKPASDVQIIQVKIVPPAGVTLSRILSNVGHIENQLSVDWVRAYQSSQIQANMPEGESRQVITLLIGNDPETGKVKYRGYSPSIMKKIVHSAEWSYIFHVNKVVGPRGTPQLIRDRAATPVVNEKTFKLPDGLDYGVVASATNGIRDASRNNFIEITPGATNVKADKARNQRERDQIEKEQGSKLTIITSRENPLARIFEYGDYQKELEIPREKGKDRINWFPGILTNDQKAEDNFDSEEPSLLIAGSSGSGKSVVLQNMLLQLASKNDPSDLQFWMVEPKIGLQRFEHLDNTVRFVDSWTPSEDFYENVANFFEDLVEEMKRRNRLFRNHSDIPEKLVQARKIAQREGPSADGTPHPMMVPHIVAVIEECATVYAGALTKEEQEFQKEILGNAARIAREGRSAGIYLVNLTQYPTNAAIPMTIRQQSRRIGLKTRDSLASKVIIDETGLEQLSIKGTGLIQEGGMYRMFRGFWLRDGDTSLGEPNDIQNALSRLPQNTKGQAQQQPGGFVTLPDPEDSIFQKWERKAGQKLDQYIEDGKKTRDPSMLA